MRDVNYNGLPEAMRGEMRRYIERGIPPGGFVTAVLENNLVKAYNRADQTNFDAMDKWAFFLHNEAPRGAWGSAPHVAAWIQKGGMKGGADETDDC